MKHIGYLEEYWTTESDLTAIYAGHRGVDKQPQSTKYIGESQLCGSAHAEVFKLESDTTINRSFSKQVTLKAGTLVRRMVSPLEGK